MVRGVSAAGIGERLTRRTRRGCVNLFRPCGRHPGGACFALKIREHRRDLEVGTR